MRTQQTESWVVYRRQGDGKIGCGLNVVCLQAEWDEMERQYPGRHILVRSGITSETEAEKLARGTSGDPPSRRVVR